jgi:hypothetical protein
VSATRASSSSAVALATLAVAFVAGCSSPPAREHGGMPPAAANEPKESMQTEDMPRPAPATVADVMRAKTAWSGALLEAVAMRNYILIEKNAEALRDLGNEASFMVQDTVAYRALSDRFRLEVAQLAADARHRNQAAVEASYHRVVETCFRCHEYVRSERFFSDAPAAVSLR